MCRSTPILLKNNIFHSVSNQYISELKNTRINHATVSANDLLEHLLKKLRICIHHRPRVQWNANKIIVVITYINRNSLQSAQIRSRIRSPRKQNNIVKSSSTLRLCTHPHHRIFSKETTKRRKKNTSDKTWPKFQTFFRSVVKYYGKNLTTTETYPTANVQEIVEKSLQDYIIEYKPLPRKSKKTSTQCVCTCTTNQQKIMGPTCKRNENTI